MNYFKSGFEIFAILALTTSIFCMPTTPEQTSLSQSSTSENVNTDTQTKENIETVMVNEPPAVENSLDRERRSPLGLFLGGDYYDRTGGLLSAYEEGRRDGILTAIQLRELRRRFRPYNHYGGYYGGGYYGGGYYGGGYYGGGGFRRRDFYNRRGGHWRG